MSKKLCDEIFEASPLKIAQEFSHWTEQREFQKLMSEHQSFQFSKENLAVRVIFSHFLSFMRDKRLYPEVFCWVGAWMAGDRISGNALKLFERHGALFVDKENDDGVYPRMMQGRTETDVQEAFDDFYANNLIFDLTRQWIAETGPFRFSYRWLTEKGSDQEIQDFAERIFESVYGVRPSSVEVLSE